METRPTVSTASASELLALADETRRWGCRILDLREPASSAADHLPGSASLPLGAALDFAADLPAHMLPAAGPPLVVFDALPARARAAAEYLLRRGHEARYFAGSLQELPLRAGPARGALWSPDPYLQELESLLPAPHAGPVADLGAGNGRNAVFLAARGYRVHLYDRLPDALDLALDRARRHGVEDQLVIHQLNLTGRKGLAEAPFGLVLMVRFHEKTLMGGLRGLLTPQGAVFVRTYARDDDEAGGIRTLRARGRAGRAIASAQRSSGLSFPSASGAFWRARLPLRGPRKR